MSRYYAKCYKHKYLTKSAMPMKLIILFSGSIQVQDMNSMNDKIHSEWVRMGQKEYGGRRSISFTFPQW